MTNTLDLSENKTKKHTTAESLTKDLWAHFGLFISNTGLTKKLNIKSDKYKYYIRQCGSEHFLYRVEK